MPPLSPLAVGYIAAKLAQGRYDKLSSVDIDSPGLDSLTTQRLIEETLSLVHQRGRELEAFLSHRLPFHSSQREIKVTLSHLEPHTRQLDPSVRSNVPCHGDEADA